MSFDLSSLRPDPLQVWADRDPSLPLWALVIPVVGVLLAETILFYTYSRYTLWIHLLNLAFCVLVPLRYEETLPLLQPFALLPLFRLVNLGMPTFFELTLLFFPLAYLPLLPAIYLVARAQDIQIGTNLRAFVVGLIPVTLVSALLAVVEYAIIDPEALVPEPSVFWMFTITALMIGTVGLVEELIFRGILQSRFVDYLGRWSGIVLASVLFSAMYSVYSSELEILFVILLGCFFGALYEQTNSIGLVILLHGLLNVFLFAFIPIYAPEIV